MNDEQEIKNEGSPRKKQKLVRRLLIGLCVFLSVILVAICGLWWYAEHLLGHIHYVGKEDTMSSQDIEDSMTDGLESMDPDESLPDITDLPTVSHPYGTDDPSVVMGDIVNILLIGEDRREGESRARSDSMILVTFNKTTAEITMTSFMRDSYVHIPGYLDNKINAAYQWGGMALLEETLNYNYGVEVDGSVAVNFSQFEQVIDLLGGVDLTLTQAECDEINRQFGVVLSPGTQRLNGEHALAYARIRKLDDDYHRASRQRELLMSLLDRYKSLSLVDMLSVLADVLSLVSTNMEKRQIVSLATELYPMLSGADFGEAQIPAAGTFDGGNVQVRPGLKDWFQYNIDFVENRKILLEIFDAD